MLLLALRGTGDSILAPKLKTKSVRNAVGDFLLRPCGSKGKKEGLSDTLKIIKILTRIPRSLTNKEKNLFLSPLGEC